MKTSSPSSSTWTFQLYLPRRVGHRSSSSMVDNSLAFDIENSPSKCIKDFFLASVLDHLASSKYTVIYTTTPISAEHYSILSEAENYHIETDFHTPMHVDLKRDFTDHKRASNGTDAPRRAPLFEKYQFFGPGLFMGLFISILLLSILYVGISGISSLEVSYAAFDREMGPSTQQKQSQL